MDILGIGPTELIFVIIILLLILGPKDLIQLGQKTGGLVRKMRESETWKMVSNLAQALRNLPNALADETGADELLRDVMGTESPKNTDRLGAEKTPDANKIQAPESNPYSSWTTAAPPEKAPSKADDAPSEKSTAAASNDQGEEMEPAEAAEAEIDKAS